MTQLLQDIFNYDFAGAGDAAEFHQHFFSPTLNIENLRKACDAILASSIETGGKTIPAAIRIEGTKNGKPPFAILAQLHGNEPAGLAGILMAMALAKAGKLSGEVIGVIGNPIAAKQYFEAQGANPKARQETRDAYRCGVDENGKLLPDMNRIPTDFLTQDASQPNIARAQALYALGENVCGILDIHSARGNMICVTDHKRDGDLKFSPIRSVLIGLADAISGQAAGTVQTLKTTLSKLTNIESQTGIEAGRHEEPYTPHIAASFTLSLFNALGMTDMKPLHAKENGMFEKYLVKPRITYADLVKEGKMWDEDEVYMATACTTSDSIPKQSDTVIVRRKDGTYSTQTILEFIITPAGELKYAVYQYDEMRAVKKDQVVAVAVPSGTLFKAPFAFAGIFLSKSALLYDKDPAVGPWPVTVDKLASIKFCYPCEVSKMKIEF